MNFNVWDEVDTLKQLDSYSVLQCFWRQHWKMKVIINLLKRPVSKGQINLGKTILLKNMPMITWHGRWSKWQKKRGHKFFPSLYVILRSYLSRCEIYFQPLDSRLVLWPSLTIKCRSKVMGVLHFGLDGPCSFCSHSPVSPRLKGHEGWKVTWRYNLSLLRPSRPDSWPWTPTTRCVIQAIFDSCQMTAATCMTLSKNSMKTTRPNCWSSELWANKMVVVLGH